MTPRADPIPGTTAVTFHLDSGATVSVLAEGLGRVLAPRLHEESRVALVDPLGHAHDYRRVVVPVLARGRVCLGPGSRRDCRQRQPDRARSAVADSVGGRSRSRVADPRRRALARGTAQAELPVHRIGAGADPERPAWSRNDQVIVRLNGHDVPMTIDTGAALSAVPARVAEALKLAARAGREPAPTAWSVRARMFGEMVTAELAFGNLSAGPPFVAACCQTTGRRDCWVSTCFGCFGSASIPEECCRCGGAAIASRRRPAGSRAGPGCRAASGPVAPTRASKDRAPTAAVVMSVSGPYPDQPTSFLWTCEANAADPARLAVVVFVPRPVSGQPIRLVPPARTPIGPRSLRLAGRWRWSISVPPVRSWPQTAPLRS